jgi:SAM-dependent methyltransferase
MLYLSNNEKKEWRALADEALAKDAGPEKLAAPVRSGLLPMFCYYAGAYLAAKGKVALGREWLSAGSLTEDESLMSNSYLSSFIERQHGKIIMPAVVFADPKPYLHFITVPLIDNSRRSFLRHCSHSLPKFNRAVRIMDIGCGDGALTAAFIEKMRVSGKIGDIAELALVDRSRGMLDVAQGTVGRVIKQSAVKLIHSRIEDITGTIDGRYDIMLSALAFHHMPLEEKKKHLRKLREHTDHFIIFELDANNDLPELYSPELALSVYQLYGRVINMVFMHDAPLELALSCVDAFLMTEEVSLLTQPRGIRNDYHMLKTQWCALFEEILASSDFSRLCDSNCYADDYACLFTMHYGR